MAKPPAPSKPGKPQRTLRIYIDGRPVYLRKGRRPDADAAWHLEHPAVFYERRGDVHRALWLMERDQHFRSLTIFGKDPAEAAKAIFKAYRRIEAAGGLVRNPKGRILMIHRRGFWDLPKGKVDPGETLQQAALREVEEETGVQGLRLEGELLDTFHVYSDKKGRVLKRTAWYRMEAPAQKKLVPQANEGIDVVEWTKPEQLKQRLSQTFPNIRDVFVEAGLWPEAPDLDLPGSPAS